MSPFDNPGVAPLVFPLPLFESSTRMPLNQDLTLSKSDRIGSLTLESLEIIARLRRHSHRGPFEGRSVVAYSTYCATEGVMVATGRGSGTFIPQVR